MRPHRSLFHRIVRWHCKKRSRRFGALNIGKGVSDLPKPGIVAHDFYHQLQLGRIPLLIHHRDGIGVANLPGRNDARIPRTLCADSVDGLRSQVFFLQRAVGNFLLKMSFKFALQVPGVVGPGWRHGQLLGTFVSACNT